MRAAIYARYSSDNQRDASIDDQIRECKKFIKAQGWKTAEIFSDRAISGATHHRPGFQGLLNAARAGEFDVLVAEALDRLSRDQEHIAGMFKQLTFLGIRVVTLSEGEVNELHVGLKGTMNALFLKDLAAKIKRGQKGRILQGRSTGSLPYGYRVVKRIGSDGSLERGLREIDANAAKVINRIFRAYSAGISAKEIAKSLNAEGVPSPTGGTWSASTINGNRKRKDGILVNEMYIGRLIYNRQSFFKHPNTGKRIPRLNPTSLWVIAEAPELRIISEELWSAAQAVKHRYSQVRYELCHRPRRLLSGLCTCGVCGGAFTVIGMNRMGCSAYRDRGTCTNPRSISVPKLEHRVLSGLANALGTPFYTEIYEQEFRNAYRECNDETAMPSVRMPTSLKEIDRKIQALLSAIEAGGRIETLVKRLQALEDERAELVNRRSAPARRRAIAPPDDIVGLFRKQLADLAGALSADEETRLEATALLRPIFGAIRIHPLPGRGNLEIEVESEPHMPWLVSQGNQPGHGVHSVPKSPNGHKNARRGVLVAGEGLEPPTPGL